MTDDEKKHIPNYLRFKSNLRFSNLFEDINYENYRTHFDYRVLSRKTLTLDLPTNTNIDFLKNENPNVYISFHLGPYRSIPKLLVENGTNLVLLVDEEVFHKQKEELEDVYQSIMNTPNNIGDFILISVHDKGSILKIKSLIDKGYSLFIYLDGNSGQKLTYKNKNIEEIDFYGMKLNIRNGIVKLINLFKLQPILLICFWEKHKINFRNIVLNRNNLIQQSFTILQNSMNDKKKIFNGSVGYIVKSGFRILICQ